MPQTYLLHSAGSNDTAALTEAIATIGSDNATLDFFVSPSTVTNTISIPSNITVNLNRGRFSINTGQTLTIAGPLIAPPRKVFYNALSGQGTVSLAGNTYIGRVYSEWWGAKADDSTDCYGAILAARAAILLLSTAAAILRLLSGNYRISASIPISSGLIVQGSSKTGTVIKPTGHFAAFTATGTITHWAVRDLTVNYTVATGGARSNNAADVAFKMVDSGGNYPWLFTISEIEVLFAYRGFQSATGAFGYQISNFYCSEIGNYCVVIDGGTTATFTNVYANGASAGGFSITNHDGFTMTGCASDNVDAGSDINSFIASRGTINDFFAEGNKIATGKSLLLASGADLTIHAFKGSSNEYQTGSGEAFGIRAGDSSNVTLFNPRNINETYTGTGVAYAIVANTPPLCYVFGPTISAPTGSGGTSYGIYYDNGNIINLGLMGQGEGAVLTISGNTIAPTNSIHHIGAGLLKVITRPSFGSGSISLIPDAAFTYDASSNILGTGTAVIGRTMTATYSSSTGKWSMSY